MSWKGWYEFNGNKSHMTLSKLSIKESKISGSGSDEVGSFELIGFYSPDG